MPSAGIWEPAADGRGTCAILTTEPTATLREIHDRMPVIIGRDHYATWLDPTRARAALSPLLGPYAEKPFDAVTVGTAVNDARAEGPVCIRPSP